jgi:lipoprotein NlpI
MNRSPVPGSWFWVRGSLFMVLGAVLAAQSPRTLLDRAVAEFQRGQFAESTATFDELAKLIPDEAAHLWQRGIALYYAGRFTDCRRQFESHRTVNPDDVENSAWHFLCVARERSPQSARDALLPVGPDPRVPMREVYQMFRGAMTPQDVLKAAGNTPAGQFYAHLYIGLYSEAIGRSDLAREHIQAAAAPRYEAAGGYMHMVARVHLASRQ